MNKVMTKIAQFCLIWLLSANACAYDPIVLNNLSVRSIPGNQAQILLQFSGQPPTPNGFAMNEPAKMIFDFADVDNNLSKSQVAQTIVAGVIQGITVVDSHNKTRLIVNVQNIVPYHIEADQNSLVITFDNDLPELTMQQGYTINSLDFRRGESGEGRLIVGFADESVPIDFDDHDDEMVVKFRGATIPERLLRRFDVSDFGTNIQKVFVSKKGTDVVIQVFASGDYNRVAYQLDKNYVVEVRPQSMQSAQDLSVQKLTFTGERISLNFQDIPVRAVLQLIADFTGLNMVVSDTVQGNLTLRLDNIPWDQALAFILKSKGLAKSESDNVLMIAPAEEINAREQSQLTAHQQVQALIPLESEFIQINYAKAADIASLIKDANNNLLSERGQVSVDTRTNTLLIKDTPENIVSVLQLVERLDIPIRQVMIEAQLVQNIDGLTDALGVQLGGAATPQLGKYTMGVAPTLPLAQQFADSPTSKNVDDNSLFFDFSNPDALGVVGLAFAHLPGGTLINLELQASELESKTKTIARPKLMTLDQQEASIETGEDIPYVTTSQEGATPTTTFKKAVIKLDVTPQITPNDKISMDIEVNQDSPGNSYNGQVAINTTSMTTNILVDDGETIVLGGIFKLSDVLTKNSIPYLSDIPILGRVFQNRSVQITRTEILIFVTPRIMKNFFNREDT